MKIVRIVFQDVGSKANPGKLASKMTVVLDIDGDAVLSTADIRNLIEKMELALPGVFPDENSRFIHNCGGNGTGIEEHSIREELERGTDIPHLLEHVLLHLLSRRSCRCSGYCGQRSTDLERGISSLHYLVLDCPSKIEAIVAIELGFELVKRWVNGETPIVKSDVILADIHSTLQPMLSSEAQLDYAAQTN